MVKLRKYFVCNTNSYNNTDYGRPITVHKSTDYRTSTGTHHRFIAPFPQEFDCRVRVPQKSLKDPVTKTEFYQSDTSRNFKSNKSVKSPFDVPKPNLLFKVHYLKSFEETLFKDPPRPLNVYKTETQDSYGRKYVPVERRTVFPPNPYHTCDRVGLVRDEQPPINVDQNGYYKWLDIYLTTNRADYIPYGQDKQDGIGRKNIVTFYDASGIPRGGKGYGPKDDVIVEPLVPRRFKPNVKKDKTIMKKREFNKTETIPHRGFRSEYKDEYHPQTQSPMEPYIFAASLDFDGLTPKATAWQNLAAPAMYCTENCHSGTGWPIRSVIEFKKPKREYVHKIRENCFCPILNQ